MSQTQKFNCLYLGEPTGELRKKGCKSKPSMIEHFCLHSDREVQLKRSGGTAKGRCTPSGKSHEFRTGIPIQPCYLCKLYISK